MKLRKRLSYVLGLIKDDYDHIYDTCCDHGHLGINLLNTHQTIVHFIDCVPHIMRSLQAQLNDLNLDKSKYTTQAISAEDLNILDGKNLVAICGVGGDTAQSIIEEIINKKNDVEFIVCCQHQQFSLREYLHNNSFEALHEKLLKEGKHTYEILHVKKGDANIISKFGTAMYTPDNEAYLKNRIAYYTKKTQSDPKAVEILKALETISQNDKQSNH